MASMRLSGRPEDSNATIGFSAYLLADKLAEAVFAAAKLGESMYPPPARRSGRRSAPG